MTVVLGQLVPFEEVADSSREGEPIPNIPLEQPSEAVEEVAPAEHLPIAIGCESVRHLLE